MNRLKIFTSLPSIARLFLLDVSDYFIRLYVRVSWKSRGLSLSPVARLHYENRSQIEVGRCSVGDFSVIQIAAARESTQSPLLIIGDNTYIGEQANIRSGGAVIKIGRDVLIANNVTSVGANHGIKLGELINSQNYQRGDVTIEDDVWVGAGVVVLPGASIRRGAVIAAGAVVRGEVPSNTIYGGVPAREIGVRS